VRPESQIIQEIIDGNTEAFADLVRTHQARVRLACLVLLGNKDEADDAAQDVFIKAYKGLAGFKAEASFITWLLRIAENHCRDRLRSRKSRRTDSLDALAAEKGDAMEGLFRRSADAQETPVYSAQDYELLGRLFGALPQDDREILALREVEMLSYEEIARNLDISLAAVKSRLRRAREALTNKCRHFLDTSEPPKRL
jgi:RNA polymerase sigma-70 factor (ECF subfamily)